MAVSVTITALYRDENYFQGKNSETYAYAGSIPSPPPSGSTLSLVGGVDNRVITATGASSMVAEELLTFNATTQLLAVGERTEAYMAGAASVFVLGDVDSTGDYARVEMVGNQNSNGIIGDITFHNHQSDTGTKQIAGIRAERYDHDNAALVAIELAGDSGSMDDMYTITEAQHTWSIAESEELALDADALFPVSSSGLDLGSAETPFATIYGTQLGSGSRYVSIAYVSYMAVKHADGTDFSIITSNAGDDLVLAAGGTSNIVVT